MEKLLFADLPLSVEVKQALEAMGFEEATPIQAQAIPLVFRGADIIGQAATGTGKTGAFGIPAIELIDVKSTNTQALILTPTRELAVQVSEELKKIGQFKRGLSIGAIYGGESIDRQIRALKSGLHIVVGTPGRVIDHLERGTLQLDNTEMVVLDEADEMLNMGFRDDIEYILGKLPQAHQTLLFSATMSKDIMNLTKKYQYEPQIVKLTKAENGNPNIQQFFYKMHSRKKMDALGKLMEFHNINLGIVFCNTKRMVDELVENLQMRGIPAEGLHGDMQQNKRNVVMGKFRKGGLKLLVATDVAARGIDVDDIEAVFNYDLPMDDEFYTHRIGRTARAGKSGISFSFVSDRDNSRLYDIMRYTNMKIIEAQVPSDEQIAVGKLAKFKEALLEDAADEASLTYFRTMLANFEAEGITADLIATVLLKRNLEFVKKAEEQKDREPRFERTERGDRPERRDRPERGDRPERRDRPERGDRPERSERAPGSVRLSDEGMVRLFFSVGRRDKVRPGDLVGAIAGETNIPGNSIGNIDIFDKYSFVEVPAEMAETVLQVMDNNMIRRKKVNVEIAKMEPVV